MPGAPDQLFPTDEPIEPSHLIGRADDVEEIAVQLELGANVVVAAPRRTGKTTVCDAAIENLAEKGCYTVSVDLFAVDGIDQFAEVLIEECVKNRPLLRKALFAAKKTGKSFYESISLTVGAKIAGGGMDDLDFSVLPRLKKDPVAYLDYALSLPEKIATADGKRLVLFIDEFQDVERIGSNHERGWADPLKRKMRAAFQRSTNVSFLFAGSLEHMMTTLFGETDEAFYNFGTFHELGPILPAEWREGLGLRFAAAELDVDDDALDLLINRGEEHPRTIMLISQQAYIAARLARVDRVTRALAEAAYQQAVRAEMPKHQAWVERIQRLSTPAVNRLTLRSIVAIANNDRPYAAGGPSEVKRAVDALRDAGFIERRTGRHHGHRIVDPLFGAYLKTLDIGHAES